jgi:hypothetical protein
MNRVAPNPARGELIAEIPGDADYLAQSHIILTDLQGKELIRVRQPESSTILPLAGIRPSIYLLQIVTPAGTSQHKVQVE